MTVARRIPTYFSHSYRREDRDVNEFFWRTFDAQHFGFTVDPQSGPLSTCHLEMTMRHSACFVAVVTLRREQPVYRCSPFIVYEYGLAVRARTPRLVFAEKGVPRHLFPDFTELFVFDRDELDTYDGFEQPVRRLARKGQGYESAGDRLIGEVGLALPATPAYREVAPLITAALRESGYAVREVSVDFRDPGEIPFQLDGFDFVIIDVGAPDLPGWLYPTLFGRFVPTLNILHEAAGGGVDGTPSHGTGARVPELVMGEALRHAAASQDPVLRWSDPAELLAALETQFDRFGMPRQQFRTLDEGIGYIRSTGRADGSIFLSTAGPDDKLSREVGRALKLQNLTFFHYLYNNTIPRGWNWQDRLEQQLEASQVFVPLVSEAYWRSEWCRRELAAARRLSDEGRLVIIPYFLDGSSEELIPEQGADISDLTVDERVALILRDMDGWFTGRIAPENSGT
ncbi:toll/interleukin-1 receptor domain-containing protein [Streptomyces sp. NPDC008313]|uniref:toll/interleukin-1 receptor domain-containing protein n=1 Tax=Streptomyces sp. NPDC008313 TaxID=3364826 RepID=UPI0036ED40DA